MRSMTWTRRSVLSLAAMAGELVTIGSIRCAECGHEVGRIFATDEGPMADITVAVPPPWTHARLKQRDGRHTRMRRSSYVWLADPPDAQPAEINGKCSRCGSMLAVTSAQLRTALAKGRGRKVKVAFPSITASPSAHSAISHQ